MNIYADGTALVLSFNTNQEARAWYNRVFCLEVSTEALWNRDQHWELDGRKP